MKFFLLFLSFSVMAETKFIERDDFLATMKGGIPQLFCSPDQHFMKCFKIKRDDCIKETMKDIDHCSLTLVIPEKLAHPEEGRAMAVKLGECAGAEYVKNQIKLKKKTPECSKPSP